MEGEAVVSKLASILMAGGMAMALGACGSSSTASTGGESISLEATNFHFSQTTLTFPANTTITLTVKNAGTVHHNFSIKELGVNQDIENPGDSKTITFTTKGDATYTFYCEYHGTSKGMKGTATIGNGGAAPAAANSTAPAPSPSASALYSY
jgi:plastocyanin